MTSSSDAADQKNEGETMKSGEGECVRVKIEHVLCVANARKIMPLTNTERSLRKEKSRAASFAGHESCCCMGKAYDRIACSRSYLLLFRFLFREQLEFSLYGLFFIAVVYMDCYLKRLRNVKLDFVFAYVWNTNVLLEISHYIK